MMRSGEYRYNVHTDPDSGLRAMTRIWRPHTSAKRMLPHHEPQSFRAIHDVEFVHQTTSSTNHLIGFVYENKKEKKMKRKSTELFANYTLCKLHMCKDSLKMTNVSGTIPMILYYLK